MWPESGWEAMLLLVDFAFLSEHEYRNKKLFLWMQRGLLGCTIKDTDVK
jgi:hypothetical protein